MTEVDKLAKRLTRLGKGLKPKKQYGWGTPALDVIDCVLSLNRPYHSFVVPRVETFSENNPRVESLLQLNRLIRSYRSPLAFSIAELEYKDGPRAATLLGVTNYLRAKQSHYSGKTERARLLNWARATTPRDCQETRIRGFGIAGFQYMRMLFGAQTTKPDVYIKRFVSDVIGRRISEHEAIELLEQAARLVDVPLREADNKIWRAMARS